MVEAGTGTGTRMKARSDHSSVCPRSQFDVVRERTDLLVGWSACVWACGIGSRLRRVLCGWVDEDCGNVRENMGVGLYYIII